MEKLRASLIHIVLLLIKYIYIYSKIAGTWVYGFLPGHMAQVVGGMRDIFRRSLGQLGDYEVIPSTLEVILM